MFFLGKLIVNRKSIVINKICSILLNSTRMFYLCMYNFSTELLYLPYSHCTGGLTLASIEYFKRDPQDYTQLYCLSDFASSESCVIDA